MPDPVITLGAVSAGIGLIGANRNARAATQASEEQSQSFQRGMDEQQSQFEAIRELMAPFVQGGTSAFTQMANLAGVNGATAQSEMLDMIQNDPRMEYAIQSGEDALLANASATGGLRGGNTQRALAELRPAILSGMIDQTYGQLGGLAQMGQASAGNQAAMGQSFANNTTALLQQQGAARAGGAMGRAAAFNQGLGAIGGGLGFIGSNLPMQAPEGAGLFSQWGF